ncbi:MAG: methylaspartate mutase accessory protein GlmL, partial [Candidatus Heimdallarchaeota archaeon]
MEVALLIDIGSTFTKACAIDLLEEEILATAYTPSTTTTDVSEGIDKAIHMVNTVVGNKIDWQIRLASSSAAGGLRIVVVGLVPDLTVKAGKLSAYGAGAKVIATYSYKLTKFEKAEIEKLNPDIILFVGGTDGGNEEIILWNANIISQLEIDVPIIFGGNKAVAEEVNNSLLNNGKDIFLAENVLSQLGKLNTSSVKDMIRKIFIDRIIISKGIDKVSRYIDEDIIPTPLAVFDAIKLLSNGTDQAKGMGELMAVDIGGATTDIYSSASGDPTIEGTSLKGLPLPYDMRTVEGDLGLRINATTIIKEANLNTIPKSRILENIDLTRIVEKFSNNITTKPETDIEKIVDLEIASYAIQIALKRHVGYLEKQYTPLGEINIQYGKDLTNIKTVVCTGGLFSHT